MVEKDRQVQENLVNIEDQNGIEDRVAIAFERIEFLTEDIIKDLGEEKWKNDRFGELKKEHMEEMTGEAEEIWEKYGLDRDDELKEYLPLFKFACRSHDIGRHYDKTRKDSNGKYIDHGELGVTIMNENGILDSFNDQEKEMIEYIVINHSIQEMNEARNKNEENAQKLCQIFRDRDKVEVINKRDFVEAAKIYQIIPKHFESGEFRESWSTDPENDKYEYFIERIIDGEDPRISNKKERLIKSIVDSPFQNEVEIEVDGRKKIINLLDSFEKKESIPYAVCQESGSYTSYLVYLMSYMGGIKYQESINEIKPEEIKAKIDFVKRKMSDEEFERLRSILRDVYRITT